MSGCQVVDFAVNLQARWAERVDEWQDRVVDFTVNLRQRWTETVEGWKERVVEWQVKLREAADAVSATVQVWLDNAKDGVTWVVNLVKGAALDLVEWIGDKVDIIANIVRVTAEKASAGAQWLLNLIEGRAHAEELETTVDVVVDANPTPKVGLGTKLDNWLRNFFEGLQWVEISKEEFDKATEELGEKAVEMLKRATATSCVAARSSTWWRLVLSSAQCRRRTSMTRSSQSDRTLGPRRRLACVLGRFACRSRLDADASADQGRPRTVAQGTGH